jgi:predicted dehydrogenase
VLPLSGVFAAGAQRLRVGLVGCGGRGTGAALQAAAADPAVRIVAMGDLFADQVASAAAVLARGIGGQFACPPARRFVGEQSFREVIGSDVDLVLLAAAPHVRPLHLETAIAAGRHVYCEKPVAVDAVGAVRAAAAALRGRSAGLSLVSGFCFRRDPVLQGLVERVHAGAIGRPIELHAHAAIGLPWRKPAFAGDTAGAWRHRNWISFTALSGGHFVEHHVEAIDRGLWMLGDEPPCFAEPVALPLAAGMPTGAIGDCAASMAVRYGFADGTVLEASIDRREQVRGCREELVVGTEGTCDLVRGAIGHDAPARQPGGPERYQTTMDTLVGGMLGGRTIHDGHAMCRSTLVALMGRTAAEYGRRVTWTEMVSGASRSAPAV